MTPPGEITLINREGNVFRARLTKRFSFVTGDWEYLYNPAKQAFQYRVLIPGVEQSLVVMDVTEKDLRAYLKSGIPILIQPVL